LISLDSLISLSKLIATLSKESSRGAKSREIVMYPDPKATGFKVKDLLKIAKVDIKDIAHTGGVFSIKVTVECNLDSENCKHQYDIKHVKTGEQSTPFPKVSATYYEENALQIDADSRDYQMLVGIKCLISVVGIGRIFTWSKMMIAVNYSERMK